MNKTKKRQSVADLSNDGRILRNFLEAQIVTAGRGEVSYGELSASIGGRDVQSDGRAVLNSARKYIEKEHNCYLATVTGQGLCRQDDMIAPLEQERRHINRSVKRRLRRVMNAAKPETMEGDNKNVFFAKVSALGAVAICCKPASEKKLLAAVAQRAGEVPTAETMKLFAAAPETK